MFIGHFAVALAAKKAAPRASLGMLVVASQWIDLVWPWLVLFGWERVRIDPGNTRYTPLDFEDYPITHSLTAVLAWSLLLAAIYYAVRKYRRESLVIGAAVLSHWLLDWITHRPDLPLYPGGSKVGLGLWNSVAGTMILEGLLFAAGLAIYLRTTRAKDKMGAIAFWAFAAFLALIWLANSFGPPPPNDRAVALAGLSMLLLVLWAFWIDRHRDQANSCDSADRSL